MIVEIPLTSRPQRFSVTLAQVLYTMRLSWNAPAQCWILDIADQTGAPIVNGVPLVTGANLLTQLGYLGIGGQLLVRSDQKPPDAVPGFSDLGITGHLYFLN